MKNKQRPSVLKSILSGMLEKTAQEADMAGISSLSDVPTLEPQEEEEEYINIEDLTPEQINMFAQYYPEEFASYFQSGY